MKWMEMRRCHDQDARPSFSGTGLSRCVVRIRTEYPMKNLGPTLLGTAVLVTLFAVAVVGEFYPVRAVVLTNSQDDPHPPKDLSVVFEVASIKPSDPLATGGEGGFRSQIEYTADSLTMRNIEVGEMIQWAYGLQDFQVSAAHALQGQRFEVRARADEGVKLSTLRIMLQNLLATRFDLQIHWEQRRTAVYELVVDSGGAKLPENKADLHLPSYPKESYPRVVNGDFVFTNVSLPEFANQLADLRGIGLPVIDRTGIQGIYDITLKSAARAIRESDEIVLPSLIQKQLGLKLVSAKDPVKVLVVDHVEKPSAN
ncbi:MAG TPA: TIGR03435 family protein [Terracidiphilus sp.]|nr:TIGR03435 family protein [Terracidiphilus sp.]